MPPPPPPQPKSLEDGQSCARPATLKLPCDVHKHRRNTPGTCCNRVNQRLLQILLWRKPWTKSILLTYLFILYAFVYTCMSEDIIVGTCKHLSVRCACVPLWVSLISCTCYIRSFKNIIVYVLVRVFYMYISEMVIFTVLNLLYPTVPFTRFFFFFNESLYCLLKIILIFFNKCNETFYLKDDLSWLLYCKL